MAGILFSKSSGVNDSIYGKSQEPIKLFLEKKVEAFEEMSALPHVFMQDKTKSFAEKYTSMTSMHGFEPVGEGGAYPQDEMREGYSAVLEPVTWKDSFSITQEMMEDSKLLDLRGRPAAFINGYERTRELYGAAILGGATKGGSVTFRGKSYSTKCADGKPLFDKLHPSITGGKAQSNRFSDAFSNDALMKAEAKMQSFRDDNGNILAIAPQVILIPNEASLKKEVFAAIGADKDPNSAGNGFNYTFGRWTVVVWQYLNQFLDSSATIPWFLLDQSYNEENGGLIWLDRKPLEVKSYVDENTDNNVWKGRARFIAGFNDWRAIIGCGLTNADAL